MVTIYCPKCCCSHHIGHIFLFLFLLGCLPLFVLSSEWDTGSFSVFFLPSVIIVFWGTKILKSLNVTLLHNVSLLDFVHLDVWYIFIEMV